MKASVFILTLFLFVAPVSMPPDLSLPGDPTLPAAASIPMLPESFSIVDIMPAPSSVTTALPGSVVPPDPLPPMEGCDACPPALPLMAPEATDTLVETMLLPPVAPLGPSPDENRQWLKAELARIYDPSPLRTYLYVEDMLAKNPEQRILRASTRQTLNALYVRVEQGDEYAKIREMWTETFGVDVWYPYFKVKDVERWVKKRFSFRIRKMKCKPFFKKGLITYICEKKF